MAHAKVPAEPSVPYFCTGFVLVLKILISRFRFFNFSQVLSVPGFGICSNFRLSFKTPYTDKQLSLQRKRWIPSFNYLIISTEKGNVCRSEIRESSIFPI